MPRLEPVRFVKVDKAREQLHHAEMLLRHFRHGKPFKREYLKEADQWVKKLPSILEGLPQTFEIDQQVCYRDPAGAVVDGVIVATVTCHERYIVSPGDSRESKREPMFMLDMSRIVKRGETPPPEE